MRLLQRLSAAIGWAVVFALGVMLVLEATELITGEWRRTTADALEGLAAPTLPRWAAVLIAMGLAVAALAIAGAQAAPYRLSSHQSVVLDRMAEGDLVLHTRAIQSALQHLLGALDGVYDVRVVVEKRRLVAKVFVEDSTNLAIVLPAARSIIDEELWPHIGIEPRRINLEFNFGRAPARVVN